MKQFRPAVALWLLSLAAQFPAQSLTTPLAPTSGQRGTMFDLVNTGPSPLVITGLEQNFLGAGGTPAVVEVYAVTAGGGHAGAASNPAAWTLLGSVPYLVLQPQGTLTAIPLLLSVPLASGATQGFYITTTPLTAAYVAYTETAPMALGTVIASNAQLACTVGVGKAYPFAATFSPRAWNGRVTYTVGASQAEYETNDAAATLTLNDASASPFARAVTRVCEGTPVRMRVQSTQIGMPSEGVITSVPLLAASEGAPVTMAGQIINANVTDPFLVFLSTGTVIAAPQIFVGTLEFNFIAPPALVILGIQAAHYNPASPDGLSLSQGCQFECVPTQALPAIANGPMGDDSATVIGLSCFTLFGRSYTTVNVVSNGRLMFGGVDLDAVPTIASALQDAPSIGAWADLAPQLGGGIVVSSPGPDLIEFIWSQVPYSGFSTLRTNWLIRLDLATQGITIDGLLSFPLFPSVTAPRSNSLVLGVCAGNLGATNPGQRTFAPGSSGLAPAGLGAVCAWGQAGAVAPGVNTIVFTPTPTLNYNWAAF